MKLKLFLTLVLCFLYFSIHAQRGTRIAYIDMDVILSKNKEFRTANQLLDEKITQWKKEVELKKIQLKRLEDQFAVEKILLTPDLISDRELEIKDFASEIVSLQEKRFGPNGDMMIQKNQLLKEIPLVLVRLKIAILAMVLFLYWFFLMKRTHYYLKMYTLVEHCYWVATQYLL